MHEPLERPLVPIDPEEIHLLQVDDRLGEFGTPREPASGAANPRRPVAVHDGLQDGGEWGHADPRGD